MKNNQLQSIFYHIKQTKHLKNIFKEEELDKKVVCVIFAHTTQLFPKWKELARAFEWLFPFWKHPLIKEGR